MKFENFLENFLNEKIAIIEIFNSISGEGISSGTITTFVRVQGCNLRCSFCDTIYSYDEASTNNLMLPNEVLEKVSSFSCKSIICTGGEPLEENTLKRLLPVFLSSKGFIVRIETNGSQKLYNEDELSLFGVSSNSRKLFYTLDVKCPSSHMHQFDLLSTNISLLKTGDEIKFVISNAEDFNYSLLIIDKFKDTFKEYNIIINFSPSYEVINPNYLVELIKTSNPNFEKNDLKVRLSMQIHKYIWDPKKRGV